MEDLKTHPIPHHHPFCYLLTGYGVLGRLAAVEDEQREQREEQQQPSYEARERDYPPREREERGFDAPLGSDEPPREGERQEPTSAGPDAGAPPTEQRQEGPPRRGARRYPRDRRGGRGRGRDRGGDNRGRTREREPRRPAYPSVASRPPDDRGPAPSDLPQDEQGARKVSLLRETREHLERIREVLLQVLEDLEDVSVQLSKAEHEKDLSEEEIDHLREQLRRLHR